MLWVRNEENSFSIRTLIRRPVYRNCSTHQGHRLNINKIFEHKIVNTFLLISFRDILGFYLGENLLICSQYIERKQNSGINQGA